jgi:hypothetical protein
MNLNYLIFDYSEDTEGTGSFDAMASTQAAHADAVRQEAAAVLAWAHKYFGAPDADTDADGGAPWRYDLQSQQEWSSVEPLYFNARSARLEAVAEARPGTVRHTLTLTLCGNADFCAALRAHFALD